MPRTTRSRVKKPTSVDAELAEHLNQAEDHLVKAVELFLRPSAPKRRVGYLSRLSGAQEAITSLNREELLRIRGPQNPKRKKR